MSVPAPAGYQSNVVTTELIQKYLDENKQLILAILDNQNLGKLNECAQYQARLQQNLMYLAAIADAQPQVPTQAPAYTPQPAAQPAPQQPQQYAQPTPTQQYIPPAQAPSATPQPAAPMQMDPQQQYAQQQAAAAAQGTEGMQQLAEGSGIPQQHLEQVQGGAPPLAYSAQPVDGGAAVGGYDGNAQQTAAGQQVAEYGAPIEQQQQQQVQGDAGMAVEEGGTAA